MRRGISRSRRQPRLQRFSNTLSMKQGRYRHAVSASRVSWPPPQTRPRLLHDAFRSEPLVTGAIPDDTGSAAVSWLVGVAVKMFLVGLCKPGISMLQLGIPPSLGGVSATPAAWLCFEAIFGVGDGLGNRRKLIYLAAEVCVQIGKDGSSFDSKSYLPCPKLVFGYGYSWLPFIQRPSPERVGDPASGVSDTVATGAPDLSFNVVQFAKALPRVVESGSMSWICSGVSSTRASDPNPLRGYIRSVGHRKLLRRGSRAWKLAGAVWSGQVAKPRDNLAEAAVAAAKGDGRGFDDIPRVQSYP